MLAIAQQNVSRCTHHKISHIEQCAQNTLDMAIKYTRITRIVSVTVQKFYLEITFTMAHIKVNK